MRSSWTKIEIRRRVAPACLAALTGHTTGDARAARATAAWSGLVGALLAFIVWVTATYLRDGGPYDPQLLRDFQRSHSHDLVAYAVSDNLGVALALLALIPLVALALGSLTAGPAAGRRGRETSGAQTSVPPRLRCARRPVPGDVVLGGARALPRALDPRARAELGGHRRPVALPERAPQPLDGVHRIVTTILPSLPPAAKRS